MTEVSTSISHVVIRPPDRINPSPVLAGLLTGAAVAVLAGDALGAMLFGVRPGDPTSGQFIASYWL